MSALSDLAKEARVNSERWFPLTHDPSRAVIPIALQYTLGMAGEAGEVCNLVKKGLRKAALPGPELGDELADVLIYLLLLADEVGVDLQEAYDTKQAFNEQRWGDQ